MLSAFRRLAVPFSILLMTGCSMCASSDEYSYGAFGGRWQRSDMVNGRVGSAFEPAGSEVAPGSPEELPAAPTPQPRTLEPAPDRDSITGGQTRSVLR